MKETFYYDLLFIYKFASVCDYFWPPYGERYDRQWKKFNKGLFDFSKVKENSIIYGDLIALSEFNVFNQIKVPFVLVSGEHDISVPFMYKQKSYKLSPLLENPNLIKWFSINVDFVHPKLECIPIGLAKHIPILIKATTENLLNENYMAWNVVSLYNDVEYFFHNFLNIHSVKDNYRKMDKKMLYCRMTVSNSENTFHLFENIRSETLKKLKLNGFKDIEHQLVYWTDYITEMVNYKFCLSLPGQGLDCYRTWEALSIGVIPVVISTNLNVLYENLPVVIVDDFSIVTEEFLNKKHEEICSNLDNYDWHKLSTSYWIHKIKGELNIRKKISKSSDYELEKVIEHIRYSLEKAANGCSKLTNEILQFPGMSGLKTRHFYNNICSMDNCRYLEIGTWHGSSSISAMYKNNLNGIFIDNYSLFEGNKEIFLEAAEKYKTESKYRLLDENCWGVNLAGLQTVNTYLYDGPHEYSDHYNAIKYYYPLLEENCIVIIDDWSWEDVRNATMDAFKDLNTNIKFKYEIITEQPHYTDEGKKGWWNGIGIFVIGKN